MVIMKRNVSFFLKFDNNFKSHTRSNLFVLHTLGCYAGKIVSIIESSAELKRREVDGRQKRLDEFKIVKLFFDLLGLVKPRLVLHAHNVLCPAHLSLTDKVDLSGRPNCL